ncbi:MAG: hypothetical protein H8D56_23020, partial [Planctomycetes bacterium]|nr:hypothetical protein [Planctomycetota bacterium]
PQGERPSRQQGDRQPRGGDQPEGGRQSRQQGEGQAPGGQFQLTDEMTDRMMERIKGADAAKAKELEGLRKSDPEKFKAELMKTMQSMRNRMGQGGGGTRQGQGQGNAESGQNR